MNEILSSRKVHICASGSIPHPNRPDEWLQSPNRSTDIIHGNKRLILSSPNRVNLKKIPDV